MRPRSRTGGGRRTAVGWHAFFFKNCLSLLPALALSRSPSGARLSHLRPFLCSRPSLSLCRSPIHTTHTTPHTRIPTRTYCMCYRHHLHLFACIVFLSLFLCVRVRVRVRVVWCGAVAMRARLAFTCASLAVDGFMGTSLLEVYAAFWVGLTGLRRRGGRMRMCLVDACASLLKKKNSFLLFFFFICW